MESDDSKSPDINVQDDTSAAFTTNNDTTKPNKNQQETKKSSGKLQLRPTTLNNQAVPTGLLNKSASRFVEQPVSNNNDTTKPTIKQYKKEKGLLARGSNCLTLIIP